MTAAGDRAERGAETARVLHAVVEPDPVVARSPEAETGTPDAVELGARIRGQQRTTCLTRIRVVRGSYEECLRELGLEGVGIGHAPPAECRTAAEPRARPRMPV